VSGRAERGDLEAGVGSDRARCGRCRHFCNAALDLERRMPGLASLGSAFGAVRDEDGLCRVHDRWIKVSARCADFVPARAAADRAAHTARA
jgi:hypothetical protein